MNNIDKSKARKYELASNLLDKMYSELDYATEKEKVAIILSRKHKFDALLLIDVLIEGGHVEGNINSEVYDMYAFCSEELGLQTMSKYEFSKMICRYFGFTTKPQRFGDKLDRIFVKRVEIKKPTEPFSVIGMDNWEAASAEEKMQIVKKVCSGDITVSHYDFEMMLNFVMEQAEN
jgi:CRISPR/Cas system-associated protein Cas5 (RAMP superfamily)